MRTHPWISRNLNKFESPAEASAARHLGATPCAQFSTSRIYPQTTLTYLFD